MKWMISFLIAGFLVSACNSGGNVDSISKPYKFDRNKLDKMVKEKKAIYDIGKRGDGTLMYEKYYLGDSVKYELNFDSKSNLQSVYKFDEHGQTIWEERYYPNGQRKSHWNMKTIKEDGRFSTTYDGYYEQYFENGNVSERGVYQNQEIRWNQKITKEGLPADTIFYEYKQQ